MKTLNQLLLEIGGEEIQIANVELTTDKDAVVITLWAMKQPHVMQMTLVMPYVPEVVEGYDLGDMGRKVQQGFQKFLKGLDKKGDA